MTRNSTPIVLKVQRPINTNDPDAHWLLYSEDRKIEINVPQKMVAPDIIKAMGHDFKMYINAHVSHKEGCIYMLKRLPASEQPWW
jgi:hypothetical protein